MRNVEEVQTVRFVFNSFVTQKDTTLSLESKNGIESDKQQ